MQIILGTNTRIKIASGTIMDEAGNLNDEMIIQVTPPVIQSVAISDDNHDVTVTYHVYAIDNTGGSLKNQIRLVKDGRQNSLNDGDTVSVVDGKLVVHFATALSGSNNQISINGYSIKDLLGNVVGDKRITNVFQANDLDDPIDTKAPKYIESYYSNSFNTVNFIFDEDVVIADADVAAFRANIQWYDSGNPYGWRIGLPADAIVTTQGHVVSIAFVAYPGVYRQVIILDNAVRLISDTVGNENGGDQYISEWIDNNTMLSTKFSMYADYNNHFSYNGRRLDLKFRSNYDLVDKTIIDGVSHLKEAITISVDGSPFSALSEDDIVTVQGQRMIILFHNAKTVGSVKVRITEDVVGDQYDYQRNRAVDQVVSYNTPDITGYMLSDTASEFAFADYEIWGNNVKDIYIEEYVGNSWVYRQLNSSEYTMTAGKLILNHGVFQEGHYYYVSINADGYSSKYFDGTAHKSSELFYVTAPVVTAQNGITASINLFNNIAQDYSDYLVTGTQTVIFQLMNGSTPVSIVASTLKAATGTYTAHFNVSDAGTNPKYTVRAFVVSSYSSDLANVGLNLATVKTQKEMDQLIMMTNND